MSGMGYAQTPASSSISKLLVLAHFLVTSKHTRAPAACSLFHILDNQESRAMEGLEIYLSMCKPKVAFCQCLMGSPDREKKTEPFKKTCRYKEPCKLTGFPKLSVRVVTAQMRLNKGVAIEQ